MTFALKLIADISFYLTFASFIMYSFEVPALFILIQPIIYIIYCLIKPKAKAYDYEPVFSLYIKLFAPFSLFALAFTRVAFETASFPFALIFFVSSISLMRMSRHDLQVQKQFWFRLINLLPIAAVFLAGLVLSSRLLLAVLRGLYFNIILPILLFIIDILIILTAPIDINIHLPERTTEGQTVQANYEFIESLRAAATTTYFDLNTTIISVLLLVLAVFIVVKLLHWMANISRLSVGGAEGLSQEYLPLDSQSKKSKAKGTRRYYRKFLQLCWKRGIKGQTSTDYIINAEAAELRELYLPVRYGNKASDNSKAAKKLYRHIKRGTL